MELRARSIVTLAAIFGAAVLAAGLASFAKAGDAPATGIPSPSIATSLPANGDPFGRRAALAGAGITFGFTYTAEVIGNPAGGISQGAAYDGLLKGNLDADLEKIFGFKNLSFHTSGYQIHSTDHFTAENLGSLVTSSNIESFDSTLLFELWLEQKFLDNKLSLRFGQLAADSEFLISDTAGRFIANTYGWAIFPSVNLPTGGPIYPLATPGVRLRFDPNEAFSALLAVYNGNPVDPRFDPPRGRERYGLAARIDDPPLVMGEVQWKYNRDKGASFLPGTIKAGGWQNFGKFDDQRFGSDGLSLANPASNGIAAQRRGSFGIYGIIDQQLYQIPGAEQGKGVATFARVIAGPQDTSAVSFYADSGVVFSGLVVGRPNDAFGLAVAYSKISGSAIDLDEDARAFGSGALVRDGEVDLEINYQAEIVSGWTVQPVFQYIWHPGGNVANPADPAGAAIPDATVFALRTTVNY